VKVLWLLVAAVLAVGILFALIALPVINQHIIAPQQWQMQIGCQGNLNKVLGPALDQFRKNENRYPRYLSDLVPRYLGSIPKCPATTHQILGYHLSSGGADTYSSGYQVDQTAQECTVICSGNRHASVASAGMRNPEWSSR